MTRGPQAGPAAADVAPAVSRALLAAPMKSLGRTAQETTAAPHRALLADEAVARRAWLIADIRGSLVPRIMPVRIRAQARP